MANRRLNGVLAAGLAALVVLLAVLAAVGAVRSDDGTTSQALSIYSNDDPGARALYLWLGEIGFRTTSIERRTFAVSDDTRLLFILTPRMPMEPRAVETVLNWVRRGGTLVHVTQSQNRLLDSLAVRLDRLPASTTRILPLQPVLTRPPVKNIELETRATLAADDPAWVAVLGTGDRVTALERRLGAGRVIVLSTVAPLTNAGLRTGDNWKLALNLLADVPAGARVAFDEYHHGLTESGTLSTLLVREPWGWAILYSCAMIFAYLALAGRRFGRPLVLLPEGTRRTRGEYVSTMAGLLHQGDHRAWLRERYVRQTKRALALRFRISTDGGTAAIASAVATRRPIANRLVQPIGRLEGSEQLSEAGILALIAEVESVRGELLGS